MRTTSKQLETLIEHINQRLETTEENRFNLEYHTNAARLCQNTKSPRGEIIHNGKDISPRMSLSELFIWIHAFKRGIYAAQDPERNPN